MLTESMIDISISIGQNTIIYPHNPPVKITMFKNPGGFSYLSQISIGSHTGTHIDAPKHVLKDGAMIHALPLHIFVGPCRVLDMTASNVSITKKDLLKKNIQTKERILFKTKNSLKGYNTFYSDYIFLSSDGAVYLAEKKAMLVGIDYLSIKQRGSKDNTPHTALLNNAIPILEGIDLSQAKERSYFLVALPLKFDSIEASPCRAVLFSL